MKKKLLWVLVLSLLLSCLCGCGEDEEPSFQFPSGSVTEAITEPSTETTAESVEETTTPPAKLFQVAMITDYADITDLSMNQAVYEAGRDWCETHSIPYTYYKPDHDSTDARIASIEQAIREGANVLLLPGYSFAGAIVETAEQYPEVYYIALDMSEFDLQDAAGCADNYSYVYPKNVFATVYREEIAGFLAGYAAIKMGYRDLGFVGGLAVPAVMRYGYGFIQGADHAAGELGIDAAVKYAYLAYAYDCSNDREKYSTKWYNDGTEVIFPCGGGIYYGMNLNLKMIGTDINMKDYINGNEYSPPLDVITSAMKNYSATVSWALSQLILEDRWDDLGGTVHNLGLVSGEDLEKNYVILPDNTSWNDSFTREDYAAITNAIFTGAVTVDNNIEQELTAKHITVDYQGFWK